MNMLRSVLLCGVVGVAFIGPMSEQPAEAGTVFNLPPQGTTGPVFYTTATIVTPAYNVQCGGNPLPTGVAHLRTTFTNPDGKHFQFQFHAHMETKDSPTITLDFSKHTTQDWTAEYPLTTGGTVHDFQVDAVQTENGKLISSMIAGYMHIGCGSTVKKPAPDAPPPVSTPPACADYDPKTVNIMDKNGVASVMSTGPFAQSLYVAKKQADAEMALGIFQHFNNECLVGGPGEPDSLNVFNGEGASKSENKWGGKCTPYDGKTMTVQNDAKGWLVVSADNKGIGRYALEADAMAVAEVAKKRSFDCFLGDGTEPKELVLHYLH